MSVRRRAATVLALCAAASLAGCSGSASGSASGSGPGAAPGGPTAAAAAKASPSRDAAARELQAFLDSWRADGLAVAARTYLVSNQHVGQGAKVPVLAAGSVTKTRNGPLGAGGALVLDVDLSLTFTGDAGTWRNGINERFVTFTPRPGAVPYVMSIAAAR